MAMNKATQCPWLLEESKAWGSVLLPVGHIHLPTWRSRRKERAEVFSASPRHSPAAEEKPGTNGARGTAQVQPSTRGSSPPPERRAAPATLAFALTASKSPHRRYLGQQLIFKTPGPILTHLSQTVVSPPSPR